jgi:adenosylhomocysteine nucleosidase
MRFLCLSFLVALTSCLDEIQNPKIIILISANAEWKVIKELFPNEQYTTTPWGEYFVNEIKTGEDNKPVIFFHEGWGKVSAAGATQYAIDKWNPDVLINLGTCGGFEGTVNKFEILLVDRTIIYDIREAMGDSREAIEDYSTTIDLSWIDFPDSIRKTVMVSADKDLIPHEIEMLKRNYNAIAGDWETGAIAYTSLRNKKKLLILRGVTDFVNDSTGEAYGNNAAFVGGTKVVMKKLVDDLPAWLDAIKTD